jgi:hypothetical protein
MAGPNPSWAGTGRDVKKATRDWRRAVAAPGPSGEPTRWRRVGREWGRCLGSTRAPDLNEEGRHRAWSPSPPGAGLANPGPRA